VVVARAGAASRQVPGVLLADLVLFDLAGIAPASGD
jgi:hypothetical protein